MTFEEFLKDLASRIELLCHRKRLAFAASCCERAAPNYATFCRIAKCKDPTVLVEALAATWTLLKAPGSVSAEQISKLRQRCMDAAPSSDNDPSIEAAAAQEACLSVAILLDLIHDPSPVHAQRIATFSRDTLDMLVQMNEGLDPSDPRLEAKIAASALMQNELSKQNSDLEYLKSVDSLTPAFFDEFRASAMLGV